MDVMKESDDAPLNSPKQRNNIQYYNNQTQNSLEWGCLSIYLYSKVYNSIKIQI